MKCSNSMFREYGSLRVIATAAEILGHAAANCLPLPLKGLDGPSTQRVAHVVQTLQLA